MFRQIKKINNKEYNYLEHSFRIGKKIRKISFYISKEEKQNLKQFILKNLKLFKFGVVASVYLKRFSNSKQEQK